MSWFEREEDELVRRVNAGEITQKEFDREIREMHDEMRGQAEEEARAAYDRIMDNY